MKKLSCLLFLISCFPLMARKSFTLHVTQYDSHVLGGPPASFDRCISYKGVPVKVHASILPQTKEHDADVIVVFECPKNDTTQSFYLVGGCHLYPGLSNSSYPKNTNYFVKLKRIEADCLLEWQARNPLADFPVIYSRYTKMGHEVVARIKVKPDWENPEKSIIKIKFRDAIVFKDKLYHTTNPNVAFDEPIPSFDYIQNGKYYKWNSESKKWKKRRRY